MISVDGADAYFATRTKAKQWAEFSADQRIAAVAQARRDLARLVGRPMRDDEPQYVEGERQRDSYAVYEQALYALLRDATAEGGGSDIPSLDPDEKVSTARTLGNGVGQWSREALKWLCGGTVRVELVMS